MTETTRRALEIARRLPSAEEPEIPAGKVSVWVLASGSRANSLLITSGPACLMVDAGLSVEQARAAARGLGWKLTRLDGLLLTHCHHDHSAHATKLAVEFGCRVYGSPSTKAALDPAPPHYRFAQPEYEDDEDLIDVRPPSYRKESAEDEAVFRVQPIAVDHDAPGALAWRIVTQGKSIVVAQDLGRVSSQLLKACREADCLCIEANYDPEMLAASRYDQSLKDRIAADDGHLANAGALEALRACQPARLQAVCAVHISEESNDPALVDRLLRAAVQTGGYGARVYVSGAEPLRLDLNGGPDSHAVVSISDERRRANALDQRVDSLIAEERAGREESQRRMVQLAQMFEEMQSLFEGKDSGAPLCGCANFTEWLSAKAAGLGMSKREGWYVKKVGKFVLPDIGHETAGSIPIEANKALALYAENKGKIPEDLVEFAKSHPAHETKDEVFSRLNGNGSMHYGGPATKWVITTGRDRMRAIHEAIDRLKAKIGTEDEAEIVEMALVTLEQERDEAATHELVSIQSGNGSTPPDISEFLESLEDVPLEESGADLQ